MLTPTLTKQCVGFMIGSFLFALGSAPGFGTWAGATASNTCYFVGAWFFTAAGLVQWILSGPMLTDLPDGHGRMIRADWLAAGTQSIGTILFNVSTTAALYVKTTHGEQQLVWNPDAGGSVFFLVSGWFVLVAFTHLDGRKWAPSSSDWWCGQINMLGCIAFGVSAVGGFVSKTGVTVDATLANWGTFIGALCFFFASFIALVVKMRGERSAAPTAA